MDLYTMTPRETCRDADGQCVNLLPDSTPEIYSTCTIYDSTISLHDTDLHVACRNGDLKKTKDLVEKCYCNVNLPNHRKETPLHLACQHGYTSIVWYLVESCGCNVNTADDDGNTPLHSACQNGNLEIITFLVDKCHCDVNATNTSKKTPLHQACQRGHGYVSIVQYLVESCRCNVSDLDDDGNTPLHYACQSGHLEVTVYLMEKCQCDINITNNLKETPLHLACRNGQLKVVSYIIKKCHCDVNITNETKESALHLACRSGQWQVVACVVERCDCDVNLVNINGETALHLGNRLKMAECLVKNQNFEPNCQYSDGTTPLHLLYKRGQERIAECVVNHPKFDPWYRYKDGSSILQLACREGWLSVVKNLVEEKNVDLNHKNEQGETVLFEACQKGQLKVTAYLVEKCHCDVNATNQNKETALHLACRNENWAVAEYLVRSPYFNANCRYSDGSTPAHLLYMWEKQTSLGCLIKNPNFDPEYHHDQDSSSILHLVCRMGWLSNAKVLIEQKNVDPNCSNGHGETALHEACRKGNGEIIEFLVGLEKTNVNYTTSDGQTPLDLVQSPEHILLLLKHGATPTYKLYDEFFPHHLRKDPTDMSVKIFVLGNPGAGKSTLVESLKMEEEGFSHFLARFIKVKNVTEKTAGIIPHDLNSKLLGKVSLYDFAGHEEFHSGHGALLSNSMANSPSIVMLVIDLNNEENKLKGIVRYWLEFINNQCSKNGPKPHLVLICSHADHSRNKKLKLQLASSLIGSYRFNCVGQIMMDCRYAGSSSMADLRSVLVQSCQSLRNLETMAVECHCFLVFLLDKFMGKSAITLGETKSKIEHEVYFKFLKSHDLLKICEELNKRGNILFMKNHQNPEHSWIILDKISLLAKVNGVLFAPEGFKEHQNIASSTGVVPLSKLTNLFPDLDSNMIRQFLCHLEYCQEIADSNLLSLLPADDILYQVESDDRFYFFPGLVCDITPQDLWLENNLGYHLGWTIQCSKPEQFLTHRFLQVLLLRLAFYFALAPSDLSTVDHPALQRRCKIWKNGISWANTYGGEAVVEIFNQKQVTVITRCNEEYELESGRLLSAIVHKVLEAKNEHCPNVLLTESVILSEHVIHYHFPLDLTKATSVSIMDVAKNINENAKFFIQGNQHIHVEKFLYFEPYINLGEHILHILLDEHSPNHHQEISEEFIEDIAEQMHNKTGNYIAILRNKHIPIPGDVQKLTKEFERWKVKMGSDATYCNLHKLLDQFSIFAGRNPLNVAVGNISLLPEHQYQFPAAEGYHKCTGREEIEVLTSSPSTCEASSDIAFSESLLSRGNKSKNVSIEDPLLGAKMPKLHELDLLSSNGKTVKLMDAIAYNWDRVALRLHFEHYDISRIGKDHHQQSILACRTMFNDWLNGQGRQPTSWNTLIKALKEAEMSKVAADLESILGLSNGEIDIAVKGSISSHVIETTADISGKRPTIGQLLSLSGRGGKKLQIIREVAPHWRYLAQQLGFDDLLDTDTHFQRAPEDICHEMFVHWLDGDSGSVEATWEALIQCLIEAGLVQVADDLKECLSFC